MQAADENTQTDKNALARAVSFDSEPVSKSTAITHRQRWKVFLAFCEQEELCALPAEPSAVAAFIDAKRDPFSPGYITNILATVAATHSNHDFASPCRAKAVRKSRRTVYEQKGARPRQATPINRALLKGMIANLTATIAAKRVAGECVLYELRDRALLAVGYDTMGRRAELAALRLDDIKPAREKPGATILMRRAKNDQLGEGRRCYLTPETCGYIEEWRTAAGINGGFLFRRIDRVRAEPWTKKPNDGYSVGASLSDKAVCDITKKRDVRDDVERDEDGELSGHSLRVGKAQDMAADGFKAELIQQAGGWRSLKEVTKYIRDIQAERAGAAQHAALQAKAESAPASGVSLTFSADATPEAIQRVLAALAPLVRIDGLTLPPRQGAATP